MVAILTPKFQMALFDEDDYFNYTAGTRDNFAKLDHAVKDSGSNLITSEVPADVPLSVRAIAGQLGNLLSVKNAAGAEIWRVNKLGVGGQVGAWTVFDPQMANTSGIAMSLGVGGAYIAKYRMLDETTMALRISVKVGTSPNMGSIGTIHFSIPPGYTTPTDNVTEQFLTTKLTSNGDSGLIVGTAVVYWAAPTRIQPYFFQQEQWPNTGSTYLNMTPLAAGGGVNNNPEDYPITQNSNIHVNGILEVIPT